MFYICPISSRLGKKERGTPRANHWASKFPRVSNYSERENQGVSSVSLLERDHTEWISVTKYNCENKILAGKRGVRRKVRRAYLEVFYLIFPGNNQWANYINQKNAWKHSLSWKTIYFTYMRSIPVLYERTSERVVSVLELSRNEMACLCYFLKKKKAPTE